MTTQTTKCPCCERPAGLCLCDPARRPFGNDRAGGHSCANTQAHRAGGDWIREKTPHVDDEMRFNVIPHLQSALGWALRMAWVQGFEAGAAWQAKTNGDGRKS